MNEFGSSFVHLNNADTVILKDATVLRRVITNKSAVVTGLLNIRNGVEVTDPLIASIRIPTAALTANSRNGSVKEFNAKCPNGLHLSFAGSITGNSITVIYD